MRYRNVKTGAIIDTMSELQGKDWEKVQKPVEDAPKKAPKKEKSKK